MNKTYPAYLFLFGLISWMPIKAQVYPTGFAQVRVANGISNPTAMAFAPDGRIFVAQQAGAIRVIKNGALLAAAFVQLAVSSSGERGLIGIALDPDFSTNQYIYLYYTVPGTPAHNRISRFTANGDVVLAGSESIILELDPLSSATNHNGGAMQFGKDGKLYVAIGENATPAHAQNLDTYHGKLLRINKDGSIPEGNPFTTGSEKRQRVWAYGLRNPYTFAVHPVSGRILVNDVGQRTWEEINDATTGGKNFGWPTTEGNFNAITYPNFTNPVYAYPHGAGDGNGCAITGGTFFYPETTNYPAAYLDKYFFQDLCNRWINTIDVSGSAGVRAPFATTIQGNSLALSIGIDGNLYYLSRTSSALYKIVYNQTTVPYLTTHPASATVAENQSVTFSAAALGTTPLQYQWQKDGEDIPDATNSTVEIPNASPGDAGEYTVIVSNAAGVVTSNVAVLTVIENEIPVAQIITPVAGTTYAAGTVLEFSGIGTDAEDGILTASAFRWQINFHHNTHKHDEPPIHNVVDGSFLIPIEGETADDVWYRIILTVTDSQGFEGKDSVDVFPQKSLITISTVPPGLFITVDGQPFSTPIEITSVEGVLRNIGAITPQEVEGATFEFISWSNGGDVVQTMATPSDDLALTANFSMVVGVEKDSRNTNDIFIYPNPSKKEFITIRLSAMEPQLVSIQLIDLLSREVLSLHQRLVRGEHDIPLAVDGVKKGIYSVVIKTPRSTSVRRVVLLE